MTTTSKNLNSSTEIKLKPKSKILVLGLILVVLVGLFGATKKADAATMNIPTPNTNGGACFFLDGNPPEVAWNNIMTQAFCEDKTKVTTQSQWLTDAQIVANVQPNIGSNTTTFGPPSSSSGNAFQDQVDKNYKCGFWFGSSLMPGCLVQLMYFVLYVIPAFLLGVVAYFFNILIGFTVSSTFLKSAFISDAWTVVRDLSNIFFILILLYVAIQIILDLGGHEAKKMITKIVIIALLINFSMFFTNVIIDSTNILALVFYSKLSTGTKDATGKIVTAPYESANPANPEKDISGGLVSAFNLTSSLQPEFFAAAATIVIPGKVPVPGKIGDKVPVGMIMGIILVTGLVMIFATYALFMSAISFVGRLLELIVLIIFSPFAFMSSTIPKLSGTDYIGWDSWFKRLLTVSFMAPIFMFFLYFIFMLVNANIFKDSLGGTSVIMLLLKMAIPAMIILIMLIKATEFAKKGGGKFGEWASGAAKMAGGLALGAATGGAAMLGTATIGRAGAALANSKWAREREERGGFGSSVTRNIGKGLGAASFDVRAAKIGGKSLASATGLNLGEGHKGGFTKRREEQVAKRTERMKELEVGVDDPEAIEVKKKEAALEAAKNDPETQANLERLNEGNHHEEDAANAVLTTANAAMTPATVLSTNQLAATDAVTIANKALAAANANLAENPTDAAAQTAVNDATTVMNNANTALTAANTELSTAKTQAAAQVAATNALAAANANLAENPTDATAITAQQNATTVLAAAITAANPAAQAMANKELAQTAVVSAQGLSALGRDADEAQVKLADAERNLRDVVAQFGAESTQANAARATQAAAFTERDRTRNNLKDRQADIRGQGIAIHEAEVKLKSAKTAVNVENNKRRVKYAETTESDWEQTKDFILSGGTHSFAGAREAADNIRANTSSGHSGGGHTSVSHAPQPRATRAPSTPAAPHGGPAPGPAPAPAPAAGGGGHH